MTESSMSDDLTKEQRRKNMQHIKADNTEIEVKLRKALWNKGYRYRKIIKNFQANQILH